MYVGNNYNIIIISIKLQNGEDLYERHDVKLF